MANKPFEIQSPTLSLNGVNIDTSAQGKLVIPGVTRASTSVAIEVEDTADQTDTWGADLDPTLLTIIDGYQFAVLNGDVQAQIGWTAATYAADAVDGEGYIDGITVTDGGAGYTGEAVTYSQQMLATLTVDPINNFNPGDWTWIPFKVRCGAGEITSEFGGSGGGGVTLREVNFPYGESGDTAGTIALNQNGDTYICIADYSVTEPQTFTATYDVALGGSGPGITSAGFSNSNEDFYNFVNAGYDGTLEFSQDGGDTWHAYAGFGNHTNENPPYYSFSWYSDTQAQLDDEIEIRFTPANVAIWKPLGTTGDVAFNGGEMYVAEDNNISLKATSQNNGLAVVDVYGNSVDLWTWNTQDNAGAEVWLHSDDSSATHADIIAKNAGSDTSTWSFKGDGSLTFPDGTVQTTAYTGQSGGSGSLYIMANVDGTVITSSDGITWGDAVASGLTGIGKMEVHGGVIVYTRADVGELSGTGLYYSTEVGTATLCTGTDSFQSGSLHWREVHYFSATDKWVAVGYYSGSIDYPILAYSTDGITWTLNGVNASWADTINDGNNWRFNDVAYNPVDNVYVIVGELTNGSSGAFAISDLTATIDGNVWTPTPPNLKAIVNMNVAPFGPPGYMLATPVNGTDEWTTYSPVLDHWSSTLGWYDSLATDNFGYIPNISEIASDGTSNVVTTVDGQVIVRSIMFGPGPGVTAIPLPYTSAINDIVRNQSGDGLATTIVFSSDGPWGTPVHNGEKIIISGVTSHTEGGSTTEQSYNGTYYIKTVNNDPNPQTYELYLDNSLTQPWDTSTYWPVDTGTGTLTWSHGQFLDAAGVAGNTFFVGNDNEQVFRSTDYGVTWTLEKDVSGAYFNDFAYGTFGGGGSSSELVNGGKTFALNPDGSVTFPDGSVQATAFKATPIIQLPAWLEFIEGTQHLPVLNKDFGWDADGAWFTNASINGGEEGNSYPIRTSFSIPTTAKAVITVTFTNTEGGDDFGIGVWQSNQTPYWSWGEGNPNTYRIGAQYNGSNPELYVRDGTVSSNQYNLPIGTYKARLTLQPGVEYIDVTLETLDLQDNVLDTITSIDPLFTLPYVVGFAADQDSGTDKTRFWGLSIVIDDGQGGTYSDTLKNGNSIGISNPTVLRNGDKTFKLNSDGSINAPLFNVDLHNGGSQQGQVLQFGNPDEQAIITGPTPRAGYSAQRLVIQGQNGGLGEGGDVYLWAGDAQTNGGDIKIYAGDADAGANAYGGYINIEPGAGVTRGGDLTLKGGSSSTYPGEIYINTNQGISNKQWKFNNDGNLVLPQSGDILNSSGYSVLGGNGAQLVGDGFVGSNGIKVTVYSDYQGYTGGESNGIVIPNSKIGNFVVGDTITFRNGEVRTISEIDNWGEDSWIKWTGAVDGDTFNNPRFPMTFTSTDYTAEVKKTARIKPDLDTEGSGQYMDVYVGGSMVIDNKHVHMAGHDVDTELFLGTDNNFVSAKEAGLSPARVNLKSENDITVTDTNLRMSRGNTWVSVYGDGTNKDWRNINQDLSWDIIETDDQGNYYVGGEGHWNPDAMVAKYGPDGDLIWKKIVNSNNTNGWNVGGVAYNPVDKEVAFSIDTNYSRSHDYAKVHVLDSSTGDIKRVFDVYDPDGNMYVAAMTWHPTLGYVAVGNNSGETVTTGTIRTAYESVVNLTTYAPSEIQGELWVNDIGTVPSVGDYFLYNDVTYDVVSVNTYTGYYGLVTGGNVNFGVAPGGGNSVVLHHNSKSTTGIIELPTASVKINGQWPQVWNNWSISGTNIVNSQQLQQGVGVYRNVPITTVTGAGSGMTVDIRVDYPNAYYELYSSNTAGTNYSNGDEVKIPGSLLGGIDNGLFQGMSPTSYDTELNTLTFNRYTYSTFYSSLTDGRVWAVNGGPLSGAGILSVVDDGVTYVTVTVSGSLLGTAPADSFTFLAPGNDISAFASDNSNIFSVAGTPKIDGNYHIDMGVQMGYDTTDFTGGTFTITTTLDNQAFVWTETWSKFFKAENGSSSYALSVAVDKAYGNVVVGGYENGTGNNFVWKLNGEGTTQWVKRINNDNNNVSSVAISSIDQSIYFTTNSNSVNKLDSAGSFIKRVEPQGPWGHNNPIIKLEQSLDGEEYAYVGGSFGSNWGSGFMVTKLDRNLEIVWTRSIRNSNRQLETHYDSFHNNFALGRDRVVLAGYTYFASPNYDNAFLASISTTDNFDTAQFGDWYLDVLGNDVRYTDQTSYHTVGDCLVNGASTANSSLQLNTGMDGLDLNYWAWKAIPVKLNTTFNGVAGVESIAFAEGGVLDHNPSDIPPIVTDFSQTGWNYTLQLSDRGKFITNGSGVDNYTGDLHIIVPSQWHLSFPVGSVITLINVSDNSNRIYVEPENFADSDCPRIYATGFGSWSTWSFQGIQTATLMKIGSNEWLLTANNISDES